MHSVQYALALAQPLHLRADLVRRTVDKQLAKNAGRPIVGGNHHAAAGVRRAAAPRNEFNCNEVKRVSGKSRSMAHWSSEIVFLKLLPLGWGAAVRKDASAAWPPSTAGWDRPEKIVNSSRILLDDFEIGGELVVAARLLWKQVFGVQT